MKPLLARSSSLALPLRSVHSSPSTPGTTILLSPASLCSRPSTTSITAQHAARPFHALPAQSAKVVPIHGSGPPPDPPQPSAASAGRETVARKRRQIELLRQAKDVKAAAAAAASSNSKTPKGGKSSSGLLKKRFWKDVHVREVDGALEVHLDSRPLRRPNNKEIIRLPVTKPHLAHALALEWDNLLSVQEATKQHLVPLTSLICRALDIADDDAAAAAKQTEDQVKNTPPQEGVAAGVDPAPIRRDITAMLLRYLDTDSLLCWAPPAADPATDNTATDTAGRSLRDAQEAAARPVVAFLTGRVWPGAEIRPALDGASIMPRPQLPGTRAVVQGWVLGLSHWELAGLERAALAGKGVLGAARLVVEWSEGPAGARKVVVEDKGAEGTGAARWFGVEEAARAASLEVDWQISRWGEVEDTHDVEKEDLRRQLGSVVLLVSGTGTGTGTGTGGGNGSGQSSS